MVSAPQKPLDFLTEAVIAHTRGNYDRAGQMAKSVISGFGFYQLALGQDSLPILPEGVEQKGFYSAAWRGVAAQLIEAWAYVDRRSDLILSPTSPELIPYFTLASKRFESAYDMVVAVENLGVNNKERDFTRQILQPSLLRWATSESVMSTAEIVKGLQMEDFAANQSDGNPAAYRRMVSQAVPRYQESIGHLDEMDRVLGYGTERHMRMNPMTNKANTARYQEKREFLEGKIASLTEFAAMR